MYLPHIFIFSAESFQHKETRIIDLHINVWKNLPKVNFWSYKFGCRTFFTRIARFALHKYLANWCVPFTRFLLKLVLERSFLGHFVIYHRVTMIDVSCVTFFPKAFFWQPRRPIMARRAGGLADMAIGLSGMYWCRVWVKKIYIRVIVQHNTPIVLYSYGTRSFRVFRWTTTPQK